MIPLPRSSWGLCEESILSGSIQHPPESLGFLSQEVTVTGRDEHSHNELTEVHQGISVGVYFLKYFVQTFCTTPSLEERGARVSNRDAMGLRQLQPQCQKGREKAPMSGPHASPAVEPVMLCPHKDTQVYTGCEMLWVAWQDIN